MTEQGSSYAAEGERLVVQPPPPAPAPAAEETAGEAAERSYHAPDPRPGAGDFERSPGGWVRTEQGWVEAPTGAEAETAGLQSKPLHPTYEDENLRAGEWRNRKDPNSTRRTTFYAGDAERDNMAATVDAGLLVDAAGQPLDGSFGWVMDPDDGTFYVFPDETARVLMRASGEVEVMSTADAMNALRSRQSASIAQIHHSTPLAGRPVAGAGMVEIRAGRIASINDVTGHYRDEAEFVHQSMSELERQGADLGGAVVDLAGAVLPGGRPGKQWLADSDLADDEVSLTWEQFKQTEGNEPQIRRKAALMGEIASRGELGGTQTLEAEGAAGGWSVNPPYADPTADPALAASAGTPADPARALSYIDFTAAQADPDAAGLGAPGGAPAPAAATNYLDASSAQAVLDAAGMGTPGAMGGPTAAMPDQLYSDAAAAETAYVTYQAYDAGEDAALNYQEYSES